MQQFEASVFHMVVHWCKLGTVEKEYTLHNQSWLKYGKVMMKTILTASLRHYVYSNDIFEC